MLTRRLKPHIPKKYIENIEYSQQILLKKRKGLNTVLGLFVISPLPSAQLFEGAGLMNIRLLPLGLAFFVGRIISLSIYLAIAHVAITNTDSLWESGFSSVWAVVLEVLAVSALIALLNFKRLVTLFQRHINQKS